VSNREYFSKIARDWDRMQSGYFTEAVRDKAISLSGARAGALAADVGAGTGFMSAGLLSRGLGVIAVDESPEMLAEAKRKLGSNRAIEFRTGLAERIPVSDGAVDFVFANMVLHHTQEPSKALREMARVLRPGGTAVVTDLDEHEFTFLLEEQHDRWMGFNRPTVKRWLVQAGFEEVAVEGLNESCCSASLKGETAKVSIFAAVGRKPRQKTIK
jgi:ubiquinone/menaquinone biosynthesis C-methylase UbiE